MKYQALIYALVLILSCSCSTTKSTIDQGKLEQRNQLMEELYTKIEASKYQRALLQEADLLLIKALANNLKQSKSPAETSQLLDRMKEDQSIAFMKILSMEQYDLY